MKTKVAVVTVSGKAYFLTVKELKERNIDFLSLIPGEPIPAEVKVVITTEKERQLISHERILVIDKNPSPSTVINEAIKILQGKESYERIVVGIDPGEVFGVAVIVDGRVSETCNCFNSQEVLEKVRNVLRDFEAPSTAVSVKIGNGVPAYKTVVETLDAALPSEVALEIVSEAGTDRHVDQKTHRRGLRDIVSAIRIAGRSGHLCSRRSPDESNN